MTLTFLIDTLLWLNIFPCIQYSIKFFRALQSSQIKTNYRSEFSQCLEPWIGPAAVSQHQSELAASKLILFYSYIISKNNSIIKNAIFLFYWTVKSPDKTYEFITVGCTI